MTAALTGGSAAAPVREAWGWGGAGGQPAGRSSTQASPVTPVRGSATTHVMGGSTSPWLPARCACRLGAAGPVRSLGVLLLAADVRHFRLPAHLVAAGLAGAPLG